MEEIIFPNQIRTFRRLRGKTMQELADFLDVSLSAISKIEKGYRRLAHDQLLRVAEFLDCPANEIFVNETSVQPDVFKLWKKEQERRNRINEKSGLKTLGAGFRYLRTHKNLTLADVADRADLTLSVYHRIEMGQREVSENEFSKIAGALSMEPAEIQKQIYALEKAGHLEEFVQRSDLKYQAGPKGGSPDLPVGRPSYRSSQEVSLPVYGLPGDQGKILLDKQAPTSYVPSPSGLYSSAAFGVNLCTRRLGNLLPGRAILIVDPSKIPSIGDLALLHEDENNARLVALREDEGGKMFGVLWNPEEKIDIDETLFASLQRVVSIQIP